MHAVILWYIMFMACFSLDFVYTRWMIAVTQHRRTLATFYSGLCVVLGYLTTIFCVDDNWLILPACLGHMGGTLLAMNGHADDEKRANCGDPQEGRS